MTTTDINNAIAERFAEVNKNVGLGPKDYTAGRKVVFDDPNQPVVTINCDGSGPLKGHIFKTKGITELRKIILNDQPQDGSVIRELTRMREELGEVSLGDLQPDMVAEPGAETEAQTLKAKLEKYASLYAFGGVGVPQQTMQDINRVLFPSQLTAYTGETLVLGPNTTLIIDGLEPIVLNFEYVEMCASSQIAVFSKATLFFGQVTITDQNPAKGAKARPQIFVAGQPYSVPMAQTGANGATPEQPKGAEDGQHEFDKNTDQYICTAEPKNGVMGLPGKVGGKGADGGPGRHLQAANIDIYAISGQALDLLVQGGCGQNGGDGGQGGTGGPGGMPGYAPTGCKPAKQGISGPGGKGGPGGDGGDAGQTVEPIRVVKRKAADIQVAILVGEGGIGGKGGAPGISPDGNGDEGRGKTGEHGKAGATPHVILAPSPS
ncbi:MAG: hypothetical protein ACRBBS_07230 [Thalassovita sp.]